MLTVGNGRCGAWANLFNESIRALGISGSKVVEVKPKGTSSSYDITLVVEKWNFNGSGTAPGSCSPYTYLTSEVTEDTTGIAGQGNTNPPKLFANHGLVRYGTTYYDPSNGSGPFTGATQQESQMAWENSSVAGYAKPCGSITVVKKDADGVLENDYIDQ